MDFFWRLPEPGDLWYKAQQLKRSMWYRYEGRCRAHPLLWNFFFLLYFDHAVEFESSLPLISEGYMGILTEGTLTERERERERERSREGGRERGWVGGEREIGVPPTAIREWELLPSDGGTT